MDICECKEQGYCPHFDRFLYGRDWEISRMDNKLGRITRQRWKVQKDFKQNEQKIDKDCNCKSKKLRKH